MIGRCPVLLLSGWKRALSKLILDYKVPPKYDAQSFADIVRVICNQVNLESEGKIQARYQSQASIPASVAAQVGDVVWNSNPTVTNGTVTGALVGNYIVEKWICTVSDPANATWKEVRVLTP